jgi:hypothetical protein
MDISDLSPIIHGLLEIIDTLVDFTQKQRTPIFENKLQGSAFLQPIPIVRVRYHS